MTDVEGGCPQCAAALARARRVTVIPPEDPDEVRKRDKADLDRDLASLRNVGYEPQWGSDPRKRGS